MASKAGEQKQRVRVRVTLNFKVLLHTEEFNYTIEKCTKFVDKFKML